MDHKPLFHHNNHSMGGIWLASEPQTTFSTQQWRYSYIAKGTFLSRKEDFHTKGRFHFNILNSLTIIVHVLSFKRVKEISNSFCMKFTSL